MNDLPIRVTNLGKKYILGHKGRGGYRNYTALRDVLAESALAVVRKATLWARPFKDDQESSRNSIQEFWALKDVSLEIKRGESVGIIGRNGAGKSTLLKLLSRITEPTLGRIELNGTIASLLEVGTGFHPELTGRENVYLNGSILGMHRAEIKNKFDEIVAFAEVEKFLDTPVKHYSSGMYVRLAFAVAAHLEPDVLIVDEVLAVGDAEFQKKCIDKMQSVSEKEGRTILFVSHNMQAIRQMCQRVIFLKQGKIHFSGETNAAISAYLGQGENAESHATIDLTDYPRTHAPDTLTLQSVTFKDGLKRPAAVIDRNDTLEVEVSLQAEKEIKQFNLSMAVVDADGLRVFSEAYSDQYPLPDLSAGDYILRFYIPIRYFRQETYFLAMAVAENGRVCDHIDGLLMPEISAQSLPASSNKKSLGVMRLPVQWENLKGMESGAKN